MLEELTERERNIVILTAKSHKIKEISGLTGVPMSTIQTDKIRISEKLGFGDIAALTRYAIRKGLITADE
jgi:DNA-binding NarL/FixJ family response regulator